MGFSESTNKIQTVEVSRMIVYGRQAIQKLPQVIRDLGVTNLTIITGPTATKKLAEETVIPLLADSDSHNTSHLKHIILDNPSVPELFQIAQTLQQEERQILVCGGGKIIDYAKILSCWCRKPYISVPTSASHDGFASPYLNYNLNRILTDYEQKDPRYSYYPTAPIAVVGDTYLIDQEPKINLAAGVGDLVAKLVANKDWKLAHELIGEPFDEYAASFGLISADVVDRGYYVLKGGISELATRLVVKALGNAGVAMCIAGSSRPASGSEHLISHYIDTVMPDNSIPHGLKCGLASIVMLYLHGSKKWQRIKEVLQVVKAPITLKDLGIPPEIFLDALMNAHKVRDRYTILSTNLSKEAAENAMNATEIV